MDLLSDLVGVLHALEDQIAEHHGPKTCTDLLDPGSRTNHRKRNQADGAKYEEAVHHAQGSNFLFDLACSEHVAEQCKEHVKEIHVHELSSKELPH